MSSPPAIRMAFEDSRYARGRTPGDRLGQRVTFWQPAAPGVRAWEVTVTRKTRPRPLLWLTADQDAFPVLAREPRLLAALAAARRGNLDDVVKFLAELGAADETVRVRPRSGNSEGE